MFIYLSKKIAIPNGINLYSLAWNPDQVRVWTPSHRGAVWFSLNGQTAPAFFTFGSESATALPAKRHAGATTAAAPAHAASLHAVTVESRPALTASPSPLSRTLYRDGLLAAATQACSKSSSLS